MGSLLEPFEWIGRAVLDVGLGSFVDKVEDHFGRAAAKVLIAVVGITLVSGCGVLFWREILKPLALAIPDQRPGSDMAEFAKLVAFAALFIWLVHIMLQAADSYLRRKLTRQLRQKVAEARQLNDDIRAAVQEADDARKRAADYCAGATLVFERALELAMERRLITAEQADELRLLVEAEPATDAPPASPSQSS